MEMLPLAEREKVPQVKLGKTATVATVVGVEVVGASPEVVEVACGGLLAREWAEEDEEEAVDPEAVKMVRAGRLLLVQGQHRG